MSEGDGRSRASDFRSPSRPTFPPLSDCEWVDRLCARLLQQSLDPVRASLERFRLRGIFLGGSAALGEAVGWEEAGGRRLLLSDLDLGVVTDDPVDARTRTELLDSLNGAEATSGLMAAVRRPLTVGFYETSRLQRQKPTLGQVDLSARALVLWGEPELRQRLTAPRPEEIPSWEAVRLVGNRLLELLADDPPGTEWIRRASALHAMAKAATGLWTATLVLAGRYQTTWKARADLLSGARRGALFASGGAAGAEDTPAAPSAVIEAARLWSRFRSSPSPEHVPAEEACLHVFHAGLGAFLASLPAGLREAHGPPETVFLREPVGPRERLRLWRRDPLEGGGEPARASLSRRAALRRWLAGELGGTPQGRRMAAAALYWRLLPERPEPVWGPADFLPDDAAALREWGFWTRKWLREAIAPGRGCRCRTSRELTSRREM